MVAAAEWAEIVTSSAEQQSSICHEPAQATKPAPASVAICVAGAARSFATPLVLWHTLQYLMAPLCGNHTIVRFFLQLKLTDGEKKVVGQGGKFSSKTVELQAILNALSSKWLQPLIGEAAVLNGSGSFSGEGWDGEGYALRALRQPDPDGWRRYPTNPKVCPNQSPLSPPQGLHVEMALSWCRYAIERYERKTNHSFSLFAYSRPDMLLPRPVPPWCTWNWDHDIMACLSRPGGDQVWIAPRSFLLRMTSGAAAHAECASTSIRHPIFHKTPIHTPPHDILPTSMQGRQLHSPVYPACCGPLGEPFLVHKVFGSTPKLPVRSDSCSHILFDRHFLRRVQVDGSHGMTTVHACDIALDPHYNTSRSFALHYDIEHELALTYQSGSYLRGLFCHASDSSLAACRKALESFPVPEPWQATARLSDRFKQF